MNTIRKIFAVAAALLTTVSAAKADIYPDALRVIDIDTVDHVVYAENWNGNVFTFEEDDEYNIGDEIAVIMDDNGTMFDEVDDIIVDYSYFCFR